MKKNILKFTIYTILLGPFIYLMNNILVDFGLIYKYELLRLIIIFLILQTLYAFLLPVFDPFFERYFFRHAYQRYDYLNEISQKLNLIYKFDILIDFLIERFASKDYDSPTLFIIFNDENKLIYHKEYPYQFDPEIVKPHIKKFKKQGDDIQYYSINHRFIKPFLTESKLDEWIRSEGFYYCSILMSENKVAALCFIQEELYDQFHVRDLKRIHSHVLKKIATLIVKSSLIDQIEKNQLETKILYDLGRKISSTLDLRTVLDTVLKGLNSLVGYHAAGIFTINEKGDLNELLSCGYDDSLLSKFYEKSQGGVTSRVIKNQKPLIISDVSKNELYFEARPQTRSQVTVPIHNGDKVIGAFTLENDQTNYYKDKDLPMLMTFAEQAGIAIINAQLYEDSLKKQLLEEEMIHAGKIQSALLPKRAPKIEGLDLSSINQACKYVGGDIYDFIPLSKQRLFITIGDVSGKGSPAAILMAVLYAGLRSQLNFHYQVSEHNARLNQLLYETTSASHYSTFFIAYVDVELSRLSYSNAGHTPPFILKQDGSIVELKRGGMVLGFMPHESYLQENLDLKEGDIFVAFTDGLDECFDDNENPFGVQKIQDIVKENRNKSAIEIKNILLKAVHEHHGSKDLEDDLTLVIFKFTKP